MGRINYNEGPLYQVPTENTTDVSNKTASTEFVHNVLPPGMVMPYAGPLPPEGWMLCDGSAVSRSTYARLFAAIGTTYGDGDGTTTFNLPDLRGEFVRGLDHGRGVDAGRSLGSHQDDALQNITGDFAGRAPVTGAFGKVSESNKVQSATSGNSIYLHNLDFDASRVSRTADETRPRNVAMNYVIKVL